MVINPRSAVENVPSSSVNIFKRLYRGLPVMLPESAYRSNDRYGGDREVLESRLPDMTLDELQDYKTLLALQAKAPRRDLTIPQEGYVEGAYRDPYMKGGEEYRPDQKAFDSRRALLRDDRVQGPAIPVEVRPRPRLSKDDIRLLLQSQERG